MDQLQPLLDFFNDYTRLLVLALSYLGSACLGALFVFWRSRRARKAFAHKSFPNHVNFSLNYFDGPTLVMRTLMETTADQVWLNPHVVKLIARAARKATVEDPILRLNDRDAMEFLNRAVVNTLSPRFADVFVARSLGRGVSTAPYVFAITFEKFKDIRTRKLRVLIIREDELTRLACPLEQIETSLRDRQITLTKMHQLYSGAGTRHVLGRVELGVIA
jgi:hypothetical protein